MELITQAEFTNFFNSLNTITSDFANDYTKLSNKKLSKNSFLEKYGHLRPSTYNINSLNYKEGFPIYFSKNFKNRYQNKLSLSQQSTKLNLSPTRKNII